MKKIIEIEIDIQEESNLYQQLYKMLIDTLKNFHYTFGNFDYVNKNFDSIFNTSLKQAICESKDDKYYSIYKEIEGNCLNNDYKIIIAEKLKKQLIDKLQVCINVYLSKDKDTSLLNNEQKINAMLYTINELELRLEEMFSTAIFYKKNINCVLVYKKHKELIEASRQRIKKGSPQKVNSLFTSIVKANMNYVFLYEDEYCYPFVYDLIFNRFVLLLKFALYNDEIIDLRSYVNFDTKLQYFQKFYHDNIKYHKLEVDFLIKTFRDDGFESYIDKNNFNITYEQLTKFILLHYSNVLNVPYATIMSVIKQLESCTAGCESKYKLTKQEKKITLTIKHDYLRDLSICVL